MPTKTKTEKASAAPEVRAQGHTPGPWYALESKIRHAHEILKDYGDHAYEIAYTVMGDESEANARLIAAAPDLLAACKAAANDIAFGRTAQAESVLLAAIRGAQRLTKQSNSASIEQGNQTNE